MKKSTKALITNKKLHHNKSFSAGLSKKYAKPSNSAEKGHQMMPFLVPSRQILFNDLSYNTSTNGTATFTDCEA